jgi:3-hydroxyisobutyrate dehydrogenase-like beta-hydroxyacid dehydrogenase
MKGPVGFVGTGAMGTAMVLRLLDCGFSVVVHNRSRQRAESVLAAGAAWADSPVDLVERCSTVLSCLRDSAAVEAVYLGTGGLLASAAGTTFVEHGTFAPSLARRIAQAAAATGSAFLAAPVSGGPEGARGGSLAVMVGGDLDALERVRTVLATLSGTLSHVGGPSAGLELKLVNQLLVSSHMAVAGEAVALLRRVGLDLALADVVLNKGWAQSAMLARTLELVRAGRVDGTGATVQGMTEVLDLVAELLVENEVTARVFDAGRTRFSDAARDGLGEADPAALYQVSEEHR